MEDTQQKSEKKVAAKKQSKSLVPALVGGVLGALVVGLVIVYVVVGMQVKNLSESSFVLAASKVFRMPVATVNGTPILYADYVEDKKTLEFFYEQAPEGFPPVTGDEAGDMAISRLVASTLVKEVGAELGVKITKEDIAARHSDLFANFASEEDAYAEIQSAYGWDFETYSKKVIEPIVREEKLKETYEKSAPQEGEATQEEIRARHILFRLEEDGEQEVVRQAAAEVLARIQNGEDFAALAAEFGSDGTKDVGGDLGWFGRGVMVPEFESAVYALQPGELAAEPVETMFGYHLIRVDDRRTVRDFVSFMDGHFNTAEINVVLPINNPFDQLEPVADVDLGAVEEGGSDAEPLDQ